MIRSKVFLSIVFLSLACEKMLQETHNTSTSTSAPVISTKTIATPILPLVEGSIAQVAQKVTPSVVSVFSEKTIRPTPDAMPFYYDPFSPFTPPSNPRAQREQSLGSGVIVSSDGIIITNSHVVSEAEKIRVSLKDRRELVATLVGTDPQSDIAVLRVNAKDLPAIGIADSSKMQVGDVVLAIGNSFGLGQTVTSGIISAVGRANMGIVDYEDFIQTDAAINPGNSGGALVNMQGELVGINTAILSRSGGFQGVGFAIPSNMVLQIKDSLLTHGKVVRGWLGVAIQDVTEELATSLRLTPRVGVLVSDVSPDSPAQKAGILRGDVITAIDGVALNEPLQLRNQIALSGKGKKLQVTLLHEGKEESVEVTLGELPSKEEPTSATPGTEGEVGLFAGVAVQELDALTRKQLQIPSSLEGVLVTAVDPESLAVDLGLREGDVILEINHMAVRSVDSFQKAASTSQKQALALVYRNGITVYMVLSN